MERSPPLLPQHRPPFGGPPMIHTRGIAPFGTNNIGPSDDDDEWNAVHRWSKMTRTIAHYQRIEQIGEGTYGQVYRARCLDSGRTVALKKIRVHHGGYWGMPPTVIREIKILKRLRHPRLVKLFEVVSSKGVEHLDEEDERKDDSKKSKGSKNKKKDRIVDAREGYKGNLFLVLEYVSHDLTGLMDVAYRFSEVQVKCIFRQLLEALAYMHEQKYVHRDIKSSNILIDSYFRVKLADFGLARCIEPPILDKVKDGYALELTNKVITLWYRPPEILLGSTRYGPPVDVWSAGCILAELLLGKPLFPGDGEMDQLKRIFDLLGTPTSQSWEGFNELKLMRTGEVTIEKQRKARLRDKYGSKINMPALNLLEKLLELDPSKRLTAERALQSRYFLTEPRAPDHPEELGPIQLGHGEGHFHEFQTKKKRREAKSLAQKASNYAKDRGMSEKDVEAEYDAVYRQEMKRLTEEAAINAAAAAAKKEADAKKDRRRDESSSRRDRSDRKRPRDESSSRDKDTGRDSRRKDREKERESKSRHEREKDRTDRDRERSDRNRDRSSKEEDRRKKRRREKEPSDRAPAHSRAGEGDHRRETREEKPSSNGKHSSAAETPLVATKSAETVDESQSKKTERSEERKTVESKAPPPSDSRHRRSEEKPPSRSEKDSRRDRRRHERDHHKEERRDRHKHRSDRDRRDRDRRDKDTGRRSSREGRRERSHERSRERSPRDRQNEDRSRERDRNRDRDRDRESGRHRGRDRDRHREPPPHGRDYGPPRDGGGPPPAGSDWNGPPPRGDFFPRPPRQGGPPFGRGDWGPGPPGEARRGPPGERGPPNRGPPHDRGPPHRGPPPDRGPPPGYRGGERDRRRDGPRDRR